MLHTSRIIKLITLFSVVSVMFLVTGCEDDKKVHYADKNWDMADIMDGGQLYDKWWKVNGGTEPSVTWDLYPSTSAKSGGDTWRCKECHGWDYIGDEGRYASGSHYTGIEGVSHGEDHEASEIFDAIKDEGGTHDLSAVLSDDDILNLTKFIKEGLVDMSLYMTDGVATGSAANGKTLYTANCASCHGADGNTLDFKSSTAGDQGVMWLSNDNPQETLHKIRWGHPGSAMPSMIDDKGLSDDDCGDILAYAQVMDYYVADYSVADIVAGGQLYDKWWKVNGGTEPSTTWALYPSTSKKTLGDTWRCKECHGWDYIGKDGRYSSGSHYTGFDGMTAASAKDPMDIFYAIKDEGGTHDLSAVLSDEDIINLTMFIADGLVDMSLYMTAGVATGDAASGKTLFDANCASCHGADGNTLDFKSSSDGIQGVYWLSNDNPQETLHKIRWGHPASIMPSMVDEGLTDAECGDILAYAQVMHYNGADYSIADIIAGGQLYDKWWKVNSGTEPTTDFTPWAAQSNNTRSGGDTWRCKECHGWDYVGKDGRYSSGSHYTGFDGMTAASAKDPMDIFYAIKDEGGTHDLSAVLSDEDIINLTMFIADGLVDMSLYMTAGVATGDAASGKTLFDANCASCHGADGNTLDFKSSSDGIQGVYWLSNDNPQETLHKIRWGHPASIMPSMVDEGLTDAECGDILAYAQVMHYNGADYSIADIIAGGQLYDKWWKVNSGTEPTTDFTPWAAQSNNTRSGGDTWRCKECHGWDYVGDEGRYSSGSHYTGFDGVTAISAKEPNVIFDAIMDAGGDHDLSAELSDEDVVNLSKFIADGLVDMSLYMTDGVATGDAAAGATLYDANCTSCHGADGNTLDFKSSTEGTQGIGWLSNDNPQETLHKIRWGHPGSTMPSMIGDKSLTDAECGDILAHAQTLE